MRLVERLQTLIYDYWSAAYAEGKEGRNHDTPDGNVQRIASAIDAELAKVATLEAELSKAREREQRLQAALAFWMPGVTDTIEVELNGRAGDDAQLLVGFEGEVPQTSWGDTVLDRLSKAREAALEEAAKVAEAAQCEQDEDSQTGDDDWWSTEIANGQARQIAAAIRSLSKKEG